MLGRTPSPLSPPNLRDDLPRYPQVAQLIRVTEATVPGPSGGVSTGPGVGNIAPSVLYVASVQQLRTDTLAPRDREPCLVVDIVGSGLTAGYYPGRLASSFNGLPVYEVTAPASSGSGTQGPTGATGATGATGPQGQQGPSPSGCLLPDLTSAQLTTLNASLTPAQLGSLCNLNACQLSVLMQLPMSNILHLTSTMNKTELGLLVSNLNYTQLSQIATKYVPSQALVLTSSYPQLYQAVTQALTVSQAQFFLNNLNSQQLSTLIDLTPAQLQLISGLSIGQLIILTGLLPQQVVNLIGKLPLDKITDLLNTLSTSQLHYLTNNLTSNAIEHLAYALTASQLSPMIPSYSAAKLVDFNHTCRAIKAANQALTLNIPAAITLSDADTWDSSSMHDPSSNSERIVAKRAGTYAVSANLTFAANATTTTARTIYFLKNGTGIQYGIASSPVNSSTLPTTLNASAHIDLAENDYVQLMGLSGTSLNVSGAAMQMAWIAPKYS